MYKYTCNDFEGIIEECEGCEFVFERITDKQKCCLYSLIPKREWFWYKDLSYPCAKATHVKKDK